MNFKKRVKEELSTLQGKLCPTDYEKVSRILFLDLTDALQLTTDELQEAIEYITAFQQQEYVSGLLESWVDNMVDNMKFTIELLTRGSFECFDQKGFYLIMYRKINNNFKII